MPLTGPLFTACLALARDFDPHLDTERTVQAISTLAEPWLTQELRLLSPRRQAEELALVLFGFGGFAAARNDEPDDFLIHKVVERRVGGAAVLGVVYQQLARCLGVQVEPLSAPTRYLWRVVDQHRPGGLDRAVVVDPGRNGEILDVEELLASGDEEWLEPSTVLVWERRLLEEFRQVLMRRRQYGDALLVLHRHGVLEPNNPVVYRERGMLHRRLGAPLAAIEDFEHYLTLAPHASDVQEVSETLDGIRDQLHRAPRNRAN